MYAHRFLCLVNQFISIAFITFISLFCVVGLHAQTRVIQDNSVVMGPEEEDQETAKLKINSTTQGFLMPRMSFEEMQEIDSPSDGLMVFVNNMVIEIRGFYFYDHKKSEWIKLYPDCCDACEECDMIADAGEDLTVCSGENVTIGTNQTNDCEFLYSWSTGGTTDQIIVQATETSTFTVTVTNPAEGCSDIDQVTVFVDDPQFSFDNSSPSCNNPNGSLTVHVSGGSAPFTYLWNDGQTGMTATDLSPGFYVVAITDANGCSFAASSILLGVNFLMVNLTADPASVCSGESTMLTAAVAAGTAPFTFEWNTGETTEQIVVSPDQDTEYSVTVTDADGCIGTEFITVTIGEDCCGAIVEDGPPMEEFNLICSDIEDNLKFESVFQIPITSYECCTGGGSFINDVEITSTNPAFPTFTSALTIGMGDAYVGTTFTTNRPCEQFAVGDILTITHTLDEVIFTGTCEEEIPDSYTKTATVEVDQDLLSACGCDVDCDPLGLNVIANPTEVCAGDNLTLSASVFDGTPPFNYVWSTGQTGSQIETTILEETTYIVTVTDADGCIEDQSILVPLSEDCIDCSTLSVNVEDDTTNDCGDGILTAVVSGGYPPYTYLWNTGATTQGIIESPNVTTTYTVTVTDDEGCTAETSAQIIPIECSNACTTCSSDQYVASNCNISSDAFHPCWTCGEGLITITIIEIVVDDSILPLNYPIPWNGGQDNYIENVVNNLLTSCDGTTIDVNTANNLFHVDLTEEEWQTIRYEVWNPTTGLCQTITSSFNCDPGD